MITTIHWQVKSYLGYIRTDGDRKAHDARLPVLLHLIFSANANLRCFVGIEALCRDTQFTNKPITEALQWLQDHGAIYNVAKDDRVGHERRLHANKKVWQLTGILRVGDEIIDYLYTGELGSEINNKFQELLTTIKHNAPDSIKALFNKEIDVQIPTKQGQIDETPNLDVQIPIKQVDSVHKSDSSDTGENKIDVQIPTNEGDLLGMSTDKIDVQSTHEDINKLQDINKNKDINNISRQRDDDSLLSVLDDLFGEPEASQAISEQQPEQVKELAEPAETHELEAVVSENKSLFDLSCTPQELAYYKDRVSLEALSRDVYNPCHNTSHSRSDFQIPTKGLSSWQQLITVVEHFFPPETAGYAGKIAQQLAGTAKSGQRKDFAINPPMDAVEACAFAYWLREGEQLERLPERSERIQERVMQFRALANHFEHVNFARYTLSELIAAKTAPEQPELDPELLKPAPKDLLDKLYADAEAVLGFSLSGDF